jgi:sensor histidine kinase YesM
MQEPLPIKSLIRLQVLISVVISFATCLLLMTGLGFVKAFQVLLMNIAFFAFTGTASIYILIQSRRRYPGNRKRGKLFRYAVTYMASILIFLLLWICFASLSLTPALTTDYSFFLCVLSGAALNTVILIMQNYILLMHAKANAELEIVKLKTAHAEAENLLLKQQIHPHFLFNALNTLKSLYRREVKIGDVYLVHLANFLRASISNHSAGVAKLETEICLLKDYVEMQKIRFGASFICSISVDQKNVSQFFLPSFSLQPLVENAIKHNELTEEKPLNVIVAQVDDRITVTNKIQRKSIREISTGSGLANLAERYRLLSGDEIWIQEDGEHFCVSIKLLRNEHSDHRR